MQYTTILWSGFGGEGLFYQDFKDTFVCNTQQDKADTLAVVGCFIRISKILLYAIHNSTSSSIPRCLVVLSGFQRYFCMQYTTHRRCDSGQRVLFYQDFKDTFVCNTQPCTTPWTVPPRCFIRISKILLYAIHNIVGGNNYSGDVVLSGFQRYFCMQYTTPRRRW